MLILILFLSTPLSNNIAGNAGSDIGRVGILNKLLEELGGGGVILLQT